MPGTPTPQESTLSAADDDGKPTRVDHALQARMATLSHELEAAVPGLLATHPLGASATLIEGVGTAGYNQVPPEYARLASTIEHRAGADALDLYHRLLLLHFIRERHARRSLVVLSLSVETLLDAELRRIVRETSAMGAGFYRLENDLFLKDLGLARGILLPVGAELVQVHSGVPRRLFLMGGPLQLARALYFLLVKLRGVAPLLQLHMDPRNLREFTPEGWDRTYRRLAELLELNPDLKGVFGTAWFYDPSMKRVSPHLAYLRERREEGGAWTFVGEEHADAVHGALARSASRRKLHEEGRYRPRSHYPIWARSDLLRWARRQRYGSATRQGRSSLLRTLKIVALHTLKGVGFFGLSRRMTSRGVRILAYHGIALLDEHTFNGQLYMTPGTFRARLLTLQRLAVPVLPIGEAVERLARGDVPACATVITIDDGWQGTYRHAVPLLEEMRWPATLYVATYYAQKGAAVFNVAIDYLFHKTDAQHLDLARLGLDGHFDLKNGEDRRAAVNALVTHAERSLDAAERQRFLASVASVLGIEFAIVEERRLFRLMSLDELRDAAARGIDVQLHTHRHSMSLSERDAVIKEIEDNRAALASAVDTPLVHFCYPSGVYDSRVFPWLTSAGISSATTCEPGLNYPSTPRLGLRRFLDGENITAIEFEAEICGVLEILRWLRRTVRRPAWRRRRTPCDVSPGGGG